MVILNDLDVWVQRGACRAVCDSAGAQGAGRMRAVSTAAGGGARRGRPGRPGTRHYITQHAQDAHKQCDFIYFLKYFLPFSTIHFLGLAT